MHINTTFIIKVAKNLPRSLKTHMLTVDSSTTSLLFWNKLYQQWMASNFQKKSSYINFIEDKKKRRWNNYQKQPLTGETARVPVTTGWAWETETLLDVASMRGVKVTGRRRAVIEGDVLIKVFCKGFPGVAAFWMQADPSVTQTHAYWRVCVWVREYVSVCVCVSISVCGHAHQREQTDSSDVASLFLIVQNRFLSSFFFFPPVV